MSRGMTPAHAPGGQPAAERLPRPARTACPAAATSRLTAGQVPGGLPPGISP